MQYLLLRVEDGFPGVVFEEADQQLPYWLHILRDEAGLVHEVEREDVGEGVKDVGVHILQAGQHLRKSTGVFKTGSVELLGLHI